jgi:hypothetical protein
MPRGTLVRPMYLRIAQRFKDVCDQYHITNAELIPVEHAGHHIPPREKAEE